MDLGEAAMEALMPLPPAQVPDPDTPVVVRGWASFVVAAIKPRRSLLKHHRTGVKSCSVSASSSSWYSGSWGLGNRASLDRRMSGVKHVGKYCTVVRRGCIRSTRHVRLFQDSVECHLCIKAMRFKLLRLGLLSYQHSQYGWRCGPHYSTGCSLPRALRVVARRRQKAL